MKRWVLLALLLSQPARADFETWMAGYLNTSLGGNWLGYFELQDRLSQNSGGQDRLIVRPAIGYQISKRHSLWLGYAWTPTFSPGFRDEHRIWQQAAAQYVWGQWSLVFRFRMENRFIEGGGGMLWRWREMARLAYAFNDNWALVFWDEFLFGLNGNARVKKGFEQNRAFLGPEWSVNKALKIQLGYLNLLTSTSSGTFANHALSVSAYWDLEIPKDTPKPSSEDPGVQF